MLVVQVSFFSDQTKHRRASFIHRRAPPEEDGLSSLRFCSATVIISWHIGESPPRSAAAWCDAHDEGQGAAGGSTAKLQSRRRHRWTLWVEEKHTKEAHTSLLICLTTSTSHLWCIGTHLHVAATRSWQPTTANIQKHNDGGDNLTGFPNYPSFSFPLWHLKTVLFLRLAVVLDWRNTQNT